MSVGHEVMDAQADGHGGRAAVRGGRLADHVWDHFPAAIALGASGGTPVGITGVEMHGVNLARSGREVFPDWLAASFKLEPELVIAKLSRFMPGPWEKSKTGSRNYEDMWNGPAGAHVYAGNRLGSHETHSELGGAWLSAVSHETRLDTMAWMLFEGKLSHVDATMDDFDRLVTPDEVFEAYRAGQSVTHSQKVDPHFDKGVCTGLRFGSPSSDRSLTVYDKFIESEGKINAMRWELRLRGDAAVQFAWAVLAGKDKVETRIPGRGGYVLTTGDQLMAVYQAELARFIDFRDRAASVRSNTATRLPWYEALLSGAVAVRRFVAPVVRTIDTVKRHLQKAYAPWVAAIIAADGGSLDFFASIAGNGRTRWSDRHRNAVEQVGRLGLAGAFA